MAKKRYAFIDLHRGWMLLLMIETHIFNSMLMPELKNEGWFKLLNFVNGWIAPSFVFISGFAFYMASRYKLEDYRRFGNEFFRQLGRIALIILAGYSLHLPKLSMRKMYNEWGAQHWIDLLKVDVLQCIGVGLLIMFIARIVIKKNKAFVIFLIISGSLFTLLAPIVWRIDFARYMPLALANYFNNTGGSLFPLFPWLAFMFAGGVTSYYFIEALDKGKEDVFLRVLLYSALLALLVSVIILYFPPFGFIERVSKVRPNTFFYLLRLSIVLLLLTGLRHYELWRKTEHSVIMYAGRESLLVYWLHLQVMYRKFVDNKSLNDIIAERFNGLEALGATIVLCALMIAAAKVWTTAKKHYPLHIRYTLAGAVVLLFIYFLLN